MKIIRAKNDAVILDAPIEEWQTYGISKRVCVSLQSSKGAKYKMVLDRQDLVALSFLLEDSRNRG